MEQEGNKVLNDNEVRRMRQYQCECKECGAKNRVVIKNPPYPEIGEVFKWHCPQGNIDTDHVRIEPVKLGA